MDNETKLCVDCVFLQRGQCHNPANMKRSLVDGTQHPRQSAEFLRDELKLCGPWAEWFFAKPVSKTEAI